ncbi:MAG: DUF2341 domain-containing protein, partial [Verrucomicrobiota bacterium]
MKTSTAWRALIAVLLLATASSAFAGWYSTGGTWNYRKTIAIDYTKVPNTDQTNFPVLVSLTDTGLTNALSTGFDILFTSSDGTTMIPYEREAFTKSTGALVAWVKVPTVSHTANTVIYMYYGNSGASDQQQATNVWASNYNGVWHLKESGNGTAGEYKDSTANANNGTGGATGSATKPTVNTSGKIQNAETFGTGGITNYINAGNPASLQIGSATAGTISAWVYPQVVTSGKQYRVFGKSIASNQEYAFGWDYNNIAVTIKGASYTTTTSPIVINNWYYLTFVFSGGNTIAIYTNGTLLTSQSITTASTGS